MIEKKNTGDKNTGYWNTGDWNTGDGNTGDWNTGNRNTGDWNTGDRNTGDKNTGDWNSGNWNTGYRNTGNRNTGDKNTGNWNTGDKNTGFFNTDTPTIRIFNKDSGVSGEIDFPSYFYFDVLTTKWIEEKDMTEEEKSDNPTYKTTGGYLKEYEVDKTLKTYWRKAFDKAPISEIKDTIKLPNFDYGIFEEITGISRDDFNRRLGLAEEIIELNGVKYKRID